MNTQEIIVNLRVIQLRSNESSVTPDEAVSLLYGSTSSTHPYITGTCQGEALCDPVIWKLTSARCEAAQYFMTKYYIKV